VAGCAVALAENAEKPVTRSHRHIHRLLWPVLALLVMLGTIMALTLRPPPEPPPVAQESKR
jgi:hypothetical protein